MRLCYIGTSRAFIMEFTANMKLPLIPKEEFEKLQNQHWGQLITHKDLAPSWFEEIPDWAQKELLTSGPALREGRDNSQLITSKELFSEPMSPTDKVPVIGGNYYAIISDREMSHSILVDGGNDRHLQWMEHLVSSSDELLAYSIPKHVQQRSSGRSSSHPS